MDSTRNRSQRISGWSLVMRSRASTPVASQQARSSSAGRPVEDPARTWSTSTSKRTGSRRPPRRVGGGSPQSGPPRGQPGGDVRRHGRQHPGRRGPGPVVDRLPVRAWPAERHDAHVGDLPQQLVGAVPLAGPVAKGASRTDVRARYVATGPSPGFADLSADRPRRTRAGDQGPQHGPDRRVVVEVDLREMGDEGVGRPRRRRTSRPVCGRPAGRSPGGGRGRRGSRP